MPVFARLSRRFYEVVGEDVAQQLVEWLNDVERELTCRARFRSYRASTSARPLPRTVHSACNSVVLYAECRGSSRGERRGPAASLPARG